MSYPEAMLAEGEEVVFDVHHHFFALWKPLLLDTVYILVWVMLMMLSDTFRGGALLAAGIAGLLVVEAYFGWKLLVWSRVHLILTDRRLVYRAGVFTLHSRETPLSKVSDVSFQQLVLGKVFGFGDLVMKIEGEPEAVAYFFLPEPERLKSLILQRAGAAGRGDSGEPEELARHVARAIGREQPTSEITALPPERPPVYSEIVDQIERLEAMRERGSLTDGEFQEAKRRLLDRLGGAE